MLQIYKKLTVYLNYVKYCIVDNNLSEILMIFHCVQFFKHYIHKKCLNLYSVYCIKMFLNSFAFFLIAVENNLEIQLSVLVEALLIHICS